jgi:hypothetical protein
MKTFLGRHKGPVLTAMSGALTVVGMSIAGSAQPTAAGASTTMRFLQPGHCYRFTFSIEGMPAWKVLEVLDGGWITAEVDAGPSSARREPVWVNTAQLVTVRETRCSD